MILRAAITPEALEGLRQSLRVRRVAQLLDMDMGSVYKLIKRGELEAHKSGTRGMRIYADSLQDFQTRRRINPSAGYEHKLPAAQPSRSAAQREAEAFLKMHGCM